MEGEVAGLSLHLQEAFEGKGKESGRTNKAGNGFQRAPPHTQGERKRKMKRIGLHGSRLFRLEGLRSSFVLAFILSKASCFGTQKLSSLADSLDQRC
eukprot:6458031-Amphidinium_carterae.3